MGTRSTIKFVARYGKEETILCKIYQQYDGYIDGVGKELAEWLLKKTIVNGFNNQSMDKYANGAGCLAAQFIKEFKTEIGGLYITDENDIEDYNYEVIVNEPESGSMEADDCVTIRVTNYNPQFIIFEGKPSELLNFKEDD